VAELCLVGYTYRGYPMRYAFERAQAFGFQAVELRDFEDCDLSTPKRAAESLERAAELAGSCGLALRSLFYGPLPVSRERERAAEEAAYEKVIATLAEWRVPILHTRLSLRRRSGVGEVVAAEADEDDYRAVQETLRRVVPMAEACRVRIALETHMDTIHDAAASQLRIVSECDSPWLTASLDFANMLITNPREPLWETIQAFGPRIGYTHCKNVKLSPTGYDWNLPLRYGDINYFRVLQALRSAGYSGPLAIEYCGTGDPDVFAEEDARYLSGLAARVGM